MYTYILTWKRPSTWRKNAVCRCRFDAGSSAVHAFKVLLPLGDYGFRLSSCGRLVARQATYQGV